MIRYFLRDRKHNFVDIANVFVGFDADQSCCEHADWYVAEEPTIQGSDYTYERHQPTELDGYIFDINFFQRLEHPTLDGGAVVVFRLVSDKGPELYLHLSNVHNGYYRHGFEMGTCGDSIADVHFYGAI